MDKMVLMLLMLFYCTCSSLVQANQPRACHLYTVNNESVSWDMPEENTVLTLAPMFIGGSNTENAKVRQPSYSKLNVGDSCLVEINYKESEGDSRCVLSFPSNDESVDIELRITEDKVLVSQVGSNEWKQPLEWNQTATSGSTNITITSDGTVNLAFNCLERCFQFDKGTTIAKKLPDGADWDVDSLVFYGRPTNTTSQFGNIHLLRGTHGWTHSEILELTSVHMDSRKWMLFAVTGQKVGACYDSHDVGTHFSIEGKVIRNRSYCMVDPYLILQFSETSNMEWALCIPREGSAGITLNTQSQYWWFVGGVGVVVCVQLVTLVVSCVMLHRLWKQQRPHPLNIKY